MTRVYFLTVACEAEYFNNWGDSMVELNKYGEIEEPVCKVSGKPIKTEWKRCPYCGQTREQAEKKEISQNTCPGCNQESNPLDDIFCITCNRHFMTGV